MGIQMRKIEKQRLQVPSPLLPLPEDIIFSILLKLPVITLKNFRLVCKSWNSIIESQIFKLNYMASSPQRFFFLHRLENSSKLGLRTTLSEFPYSVLSDIKISSCCHDPCCNLFNWIDYSTLVGSCNGLFCISNLNPKPLKRELFLWNPSIGKHKILPTSTLSFLESSQPDIDVDIIVGFGFESNTNDYKVLRIGYTREKLKPEAEIYSLSLDSWQRVKIPDNIEKNFSGIDRPDYLYVNGALYWVAESIKDETDVSFILRFDLSEEIFDKLELPDNFSSLEDNVVPFVFNGLLVILIEPRFECSIWMVKDGLWITQTVEPTITELLSCNWCMKDHMVVVKDDLYFLVQPRPRPRQEFAENITEERLISVCDFRETLDLL